MPITTSRLSEFFRIGRTAVLLAALIFAVHASSVAYAKHEGGFEGPGPDIVTVKQAMELRDDTNVSLKGNIVKSLGDEKYLFQDASGAIEIEIDDDVWRGLSVKPGDVVLITGEIDKDWNHTSVDVSTIRKQ